jgi:hypothetical protein
MAQKKRSYSWRHVPWTSSQWHVLQVPPAQLAQPDEAADDEYFPLLLKLQDERSLSTFLPLQWGHVTVLSSPKTIDSNSLRHFLHLYSYMGI